MNKKANRNTLFLEYGNIYFFYRPRVIEAGDKEEQQIVRGEEDIQRFYFILQPKDTSLYRLILIGEKKLPTINKEHEKDWAMVDYITQDKKQLLTELEAQSYQTKTRGKRINPAMRPVGEGVYGIVKQGRNTYLAYALELPEKRGKVQSELEIKPEAIYVLSVKNPSNTYKQSSKTPEYPKNLLAKFADLRFIPCEPVDLLNYIGTELLLIGAQANVERKLGIELSKEEHKDLDSADIFKELKLHKEHNPIKPFVEGKWE